MGYYNATAEAPQPTASLSQIDHVLVNEPLHLM